MARIDKALREWGLNLLRERGATRVLGIFELVAGAVPIALLATDALTMNVSGALIVYALHAGFGVIAGADVFRRR